VYEKRVLRKILGHKEDEIIEDGENCTMRNSMPVYSSPNIIKMINSRKMRSAGHVACIVKNWNEYRILVGNTRKKDTIRNT
jgi:hypothetical protein